LKRFNERGTCSVCQLDYSVLNPQPEKELLRYCQENTIGTLIRGPLAQGLLTGKFSRETVFKDPVRQKWNPSSKGRGRFVQQVEKVDQWKGRSSSQSTTRGALQFVLSHPAVTCAIPGAKSPEQIEQVAAAATATISEDDLRLINEIF
jgi:myo-inositol catabolism protein IolS